MKIAKGIISISVDVVCPYCGWDNDVYRQENTLFKNNTLPDPVKVNEICYCNECGNDFLINELHYD